MVSKLAALALAALLLQAQSPLVRPAPKEIGTRLMELPLEEVFRAGGMAVGLGSAGGNWKGSPAPRIDGVSFYFGTRKHDRVVREVMRIDTGPVSAAGPPDFTGRGRNGCAHSTIEALRRMSAEARAKGANAVIDIRSDPGDPANATPWAVICKGSEVRLTGLIAELETPAVTAAAGSRQPQ